MSKSKNKVETREEVNLLNTPIDKTWLAKELGMSRANLYHSLRYGFTKPHAKRVREVIQELGVELLKYRVPVRVIRAYKEFYDENEED